MLIILLHYQNNGIIYQEHIPYFLCYVYTRWKMFVRPNEFCAHANHYNFYSSGVFFFHLKEVLRISAAQQHARETLNSASVRNQKLQFPVWKPCWCCIVTGKQRAPDASTVLSRNSHRWEHDKIHIFSWCIWVLNLFTHFRLVLKDY